MATNPLEEIKRLEAIVSQHEASITKLVNDYEKRIEILEFKNEPLELDRHNSVEHYEMIKMKREHEEEIALLKDSYEKD